MKGDAISFRCGRVRPRPRTVPLFPWHTLSCPVALRLEGVRIEGSRHGTTPIPKRQDGLCPCPRDPPARTEAGILDRYVRRRLGPPPAGGRAAPGVLQGR